MPATIEPTISESNASGKSQAKRLRSRLRKWLVLLCLVGVMVGMSTWWMWHETNRHNLLYRAHWVAEVGVSQWETTWGTYNWWLSEHEVVLCRGNVEKR